MIAAGTINGPVWLAIIVVIVLAVGIGLTLFIGNDK